MFLLHGCLDFQSEKCVRNFFTGKKKSVQCNISERVIYVESGDRRVMGYLLRDIFSEITRAIFSPTQMGFACEKMLEQYAHFFCSLVKQKSKGDKSSTNNRVKWFLLHSFLSHNRNNEFHNYHKPRVHVNTQSNQARTFQAGLRWC